MKTEASSLKPLVWLCCTVLCLSFPVIIQADTGIIIDSSFQNTTVIYPFSGMGACYGIKLNGISQLNSDTSLVRLIVSDTYDNEYLLYEGYVQISDSNYSVLQDYCLETCYLPGAVPAVLKIILVDAIIHIDSVEVVTLEPVESISFLRDSIKQIQDSLRILALNTFNQKNGLLWYAGKTNLSEKDYSERKSFLGFNDSINLQGFEYYISGYFTLIDVIPVPASDSITKDFDWRMRHGANDPNSFYFDSSSQNNGWIAPHIHDQVGPHCWIVSAVYSLETLINLYFNHHVDLNLSIQQVRSCLGDTFSGPVRDAIRYIVDNGLIDDSCLYYYGNEDMPPCSDTCLTPKDRIYVAGSKPLTKTNSFEEENDLKEMVVTKGPVATSLEPWGHAMSLIGFGQVREGDIILKGNLMIGGQSQIIVPDGSPYIGTTFWIFHNSWADTNWVDKSPYIKVIANMKSIYKDSATQALLTPLTSRHLSDANILCSDSDGDGYYWWGIGTKPNTCPSCPAEPDCDDNDPNVGPYDAKYNCTHLCNFQATPLVVDQDETWDQDRFFNRVVEVDSGASLTIKSEVSFIEESKLIVKPGGRLVIDGGILTNGCGCQWKGIEIWGTPNVSQIPISQGTLELKNGAIIENAEIGVLVGRRVLDPENEVEVIYYEDGGGIVYATDVTFRNNITGIYYAPYDHSNGGHFRHCNFITDTAYNIEVSPENLMSLNEVGKITVQGCRFENEMPLDPERGDAATG